MDQTQLSDSPLGLVQFVQLWSYSSSNGADNFDGFEYMLLFWRPKTLIHSCGDICSIHYTVSTHPQTHSFLLLCTSRNLVQGHCPSISVMVKTLMNEIKGDESNGSEVTTLTVFCNGQIVKWPTHLVGHSTISHRRSPWSQEYITVMNLSHSSDILY